MIVSLRLWLEERYITPVYNNDDVSMFAKPFADRAATQYYARTWQTLIHGTECYIFLLIVIQGITHAQNDLTFFLLESQTGR